jgi:hypothetical protein
MPDPTFDPTKYFAKFVSSVEGHLVARYGSQPRENIGARRIHPDPNKPAAPYDFDAPRVELVWETETVYALTHREYALYRREYDKAIAQKALKVRSPSDYLAWLAKEQADGEAAAAAAKAAQKTTEQAPDQA